MQEEPDQGSGADEGVRPTFLVGQNCILRADLKSAPALAP